MNKNTKKNVFSAFSVVISLISLGLAITAIIVSNEANEIQKEMMLNSLTSVIITEENSNLDTLYFKTNETEKILQQGFFIFPKHFKLPPVFFVQPNNFITLKIIENQIKKIILAEFVLLKDKSNVKTRNKITMGDFTVPVYSEYTSTKGGDAIINRAICYLRFKYFIVWDEISSQQNDEFSGITLEFYHMIHRGRFEYDSFFLFKEPWLPEDSDVMVERIGQKYREQIYSTLDVEWNKLKLSNKKL